MHIVLLKIKIFYETRDPILDKKPEVDNILKIMMIQVK